MSEAEQFLMDVKTGNIPIFEITSDGKHYRIYYTGRIEGFQGTQLGIVNQIPIVCRVLAALTGQAQTAGLQPVVLSQSSLAVHTE